jgi:two-component system sensor histidine kinase KdpD
LTEKIDDQRPDPDALLARAREEEARTGKGRLKIFFGAAAGVGKTYAMLEAAQMRKAEGRDVVVGWVETHGRAETAALLEGLPVVPARRYTHRGVSLMDFDLDAAIARRPDLILLDELAHTNAPGARHAKRWQDAVELLDAGIDVYSTLNVQHVESLNDVVAQITGVTVRETVPDSVLDQADGIELVDLPPEELLQRLAEGKVYIPEQARVAIQKFFREGNLIALRELALRRTAERVDAQMELYRRGHRIARTWPVAERILVCVGPNPASVRLIRAARRMAGSLHAEWMAVYVETPRHGGISESDKRALAANLGLAEKLGARTAVLSGHRVAEEILAYARDHNVTKIVAGKPTHPRWRDRLGGSLMGELVRGSGEIDVYIISGEVEEEPRWEAAAPTAPLPGRSYLFAAGIVGLSTALCWPLSSFLAPANVMMVYLLGVAFVATRSPRGPAILASILSVAAFDFFFVPPRFTFAVGDTQYLVTFTVLLVVAILIGGLATRVREQAEAARQRERRTATLHALSRTLAGTRELEEIARTAARHVGDALSMQAAVILTRPDGHLVAITAPPGFFTLEPRDEAVARWVLEHGRPAGLGTDTLPGAGALYVPLVGTRGPVGALGVRPPDGRGPSHDQLLLIDAIASQTAAAVERARVAEDAQRAMVAAETERLRSALLSSVSHDLRTPLASITGAVSSLLEQGAPATEETQRELLETIQEEAAWMNRLVRNLLDMTRLESGSLQLAKEWHPLEEIVGTALGRVEDRLKGRKVATRLAKDLPLVPVDGILIEQVLVNLLENAIKYTSPETPIQISAWASEAEVTVEVLDEGPGLPPGDEERVFEKFFRHPAAGRAGAGLGLSICRGIVTAHGGRIWAQNRPGGGAVFRFTLPLDGGGPKIETESPPRGA